MNKRFLRKIRKFSVSVSRMPSFGARKCLSFSQVESVWVKIWSCFQSDHTLGKLVDLTLPIWNFSCFMRPLSRLATLGYKPLQDCLTAYPPPISLPQVWRGSNYHKEMNNNDDCDTDYGDDNNDNDNDYFLNCQMYRFW